MTFEIQFSELQTDMISICDEYAHATYDKVFIYLHNEESMFSADCFYQYNNCLVRKHKLHDEVDSCIDCSGDMQGQMLHILQDDLKKIRALFKEHNREMPVQIYLTYENHTNKMDASYVYPPLSKRHQEISPDEIMELWMQETAATLIPQPEEKKFPFFWHSK